MRAVGSSACRVPAGQRGYSLIDLVMVVALIAVVAGIAVPVTGGAVAGHRFRGDSQALTQMVSVAKMRASAGFTRARVRANTLTNTYALEIWDKDTSAWVTEGGMLTMSRGVAFGFAALGTPPPNTQQAIGQSPECRAGLTAATAAIAGTACIAFNSRGLPVDAAGAIFGGHGLYLTDGTTVSATTITATPRIRRWFSRASAADWREQQ